MSNQITINFSPCSPAPANGYLVRYRPVGIGAYAIWPVNFTVSPAVIDDAGDQPDGTPYEGFLQADCSDGLLGDPVPWTTAAESASASPSASVPPESSSPPPEESSSVPTCDPVQFVESDIPDAVVGEAYSYDLHLLGDAPFFIGSQTNPAWMTVTLDGNVIHLIGTPPTDFPNAHLAIEVLNCANTQNDTIDTHFDQVLPESSSPPPPECDHVAITPTTLPDGTHGVPYDELIPLTGDAPFSLSAITKPAWATVAISGSNVHVTGTPDTAGVITIAFTVTNCVEFSDEFTQELTIADRAPSMGTVRVDPCINENSITEVRWNGVDVITETGAFPLNPGDTATVGTAGPGTHTLSVTVTAAEGRVWVNDSTGNEQCQETTGLGTLNFPGFVIIDGFDWTVTMDCDPCP